MIDLGGPSTIWNGITVLTDYADRRQVYYLPPAPRLALDPTTGRPVFKLIKLVGGLTDPAGEGRRAGLAFFDCDLRLTAEETAGLTDHARDAFDLPASEIRLSPLQYKKGTVACYVLGEQDWPDDDPPERKNLFVERLAGSGIPSLYGANRAVFAAQLSQEGASVFQASLGATGPIGITVVYSLTFDALQPAFKFQVKARWEEIYHYFEQKYGVDLGFMRFENTNMLEELERNELLEIREVVYDPQASGDLTQLRKQLQQNILEKFFTPVLSAGEPRYNKTPALIADVVRATVLLPNFGYQRKELTQEERRSFDFDYSRVSAVERTIYPQANLFALIPAAEVASYTQEVNSDADLFFRQVQVQVVTGGVDFPRSRIAWVHPYVRYGDPPEEGADRVFNRAEDTLSFRTWMQPAHGFHYRCGYEVAFLPPDESDAATIFGGALTLSSAERRLTDRVLAINPRELFDVRTVEFATKQGFPWDLFPTVMVQVQYRDGDGYGKEIGYELTAQKPSCTLRVRARHGASSVVHHRIVYHRAAGRGGPVPTDWQVATEPHVVVDDPFPQEFSVRVQVAEAPAELGWADVSLRYEDPTTAGNHQETRLFFEQQLASQTWKVKTTDPTQRRYQYRFTLFFKNSTLVETQAWIDSDAPTLTLGRAVPCQRTVAVSLTGDSLQSQNLRDVTVTFWPEIGSEEANAQELVFDALGQVQELSYRSTDPTRVGFFYRLFYRFTNGRTKSVGGTTPVNILTLKVPTKVV